MTLPPELSDLRSWTFHLTPWAPGCVDRYPSDPARNRMMAATPERALRSVLTRLAVAPEAMRAQPDQHGDPELVRVVDDAPMCLVWHGADSAEINQVLRHLALSGWRPAQILPPLPASPYEDEQKALEAQAEAA